MLSTIFLFVGGLGATEVILIIAVLLLFFGAKRIPELARGLGKGVREFKDATTGAADEFNRPATPAPDQPGAREVELREQLARETARREQLERDRETGTGTV